MKDPFYFARVIHGRLHERIVKNKPRHVLFFQRIKHPRAVFLILTPEHGNLGDHAIAKAETDLLTALNIPYIEVTGLTLNKLSKCLNVMNGRPILINGGGNLGTLWPDVETLIRSIILSNKRSKILLFPSTIYYENDPEGNQEKERSVTVYGSHPNLTLYARERLSYELMQNLYRNVKLAPDMVLRLNECRPGSARGGCILCLRSDLERTMQPTEYSVLRETVEELFKNCTTFLDMEQHRAIPISARDSALEKQFDAFRRAELVITDRLHGMLFCAISGTPCIVLNSKSPKVLGCYAWIKDLPYIRFCDDAGKIAQIYQDIPKQEWHYEPEKLLPYYEDLKYDLLRISRGKRYADRQCNRSGI